MSQIGDGWVDFFGTRARSNPLDDFISVDRLSGVTHANRSEAAADLGRFKRRVFLHIAIADLLRRFTVIDTTRALSRLADECIRGALAAAAHLTVGSAGIAEDFCVLAMGKLGAHELNLSSDIDLIYLLGGAADPVAAGNRQPYRRKR